MAENGLKVNFYGPSLHFATAGGPNLTPDLRFASARGPNKGKWKAIPF